MASSRGYGQGVHGKWSCKISRSDNMFQQHLEQGETPVYEKERGRYKIAFQ